MGAHLSKSGSLGEGPLSAEEKLQARTPIDFAPRVS